jgi:hypothetical protein
MEKWAVLLVCGSFLSFGCMKDETVMGKVFTPDDAKGHAITSKDVIRFTFPGVGTGYSYVVKVTDGHATVKERTAEGSVPGGGSQEFDLRAKADKTGKIRVKVTATPPGKSVTPEVSDYEFEVR